MATRKKILSVSLGIGSCFASANLLKLFSQDSVNDAKTTDTDSRLQQRCVILENYDLKQVQIFIRHGARTPIHLIKNVEQAIYDPELLMREVPHTMYNYTVVDLTGKPRPFSKYDNHYRKKLLKGGARVGTLTSLGQDQMYVAGKVLAQQYIQEASLIDSVYNPEQIFVRSTNVDRTINTARCVLAGMFSNQQLDSLPEVPKIHVSIEHEDELVPRTSLCPVLRQINHAAMVHGGEIPELRKDRMELETILGIEKRHNNRTNFIYERDDIVARETHGLPVPEFLLPIRDMIELNASLVMYYAFCGQHEAEREVAIRLSSGPAIKLVLDTIAKTDSSTVKMYLNSCHDSTLVALQGLLDIFDKKWPPFGSDIRFEVYEHRVTKKRFVRVSYNGEDKIVRGCSSELCPLDEFRSAMMPYSIDKQTYKEVCTSNILNEIAKEMMALEEGEEEDEDAQERSDMPAGM